MANIVDYIIKGSRPKKPIILLWGVSDCLTNYFRDPLDQVLPNFSPGAVLIHAHSDPLFLLKSTLWVEGTPEVNLLSSLCNAEIYQPIIFNCNTETPPPEFPPNTKGKVQVILKNPPNAGTKVHKDLLTWFLSTEFTTYDPKILAVLAEVASGYFKEELLITVDNLRKMAYLIPESAFASSSTLKAVLVSITPERWAELLVTDADASISEISTALFHKSKQAYPLLYAYFQAYSSPLPLIQRLLWTTRAYLDSAWAIKDSQGKLQDPRKFAQGRKVHPIVFQTYKDRVCNFYGEQILWGLLKDICIIQSRYRDGEQTKIPIYTMFFKYLGKGI